MRLLFGVSVLALLAGGLAFGVWRYQQQQHAVMAATEQRLNLVPKVRTATIKPSASTSLITLPATTSAFTTANIFARASGYIDKRNVDIGDRVKAGELLAEITAPELDHQIAQAQATLKQTEATLQQNQANMELANVTWQRDKPLVEKGWVTLQQGDIDTKTLQAQQAAVGVAQSNVAAQQSQIAVLQQQKDYQKVVAPFDGVVTQRNIDVGSLVQADATSGTFMFTVMQTDVIRTQVYVPQDQAFGVAPGVEAVVRVPELPNRSFPGKVTRIADALEPTTRTLLTEIDVPNPERDVSGKLWIGNEAAGSDRAGHQRVDADVETAKSLGQFLHQHRKPGLRRRVMRQVARRTRMQRRQQQERAGLLVRDQLTRQLARKMESGLEIDRMHLRPPLGGDGHRMISLAPRRRGAVHEMRHSPDRGLCLGQQRAARRGIGEIADPGHRQFRPGRGFGCGGNRLPVHIGEHRTHALTHKRLRDRAADAVARTGDEGGLARAIEWHIQQAHVGRLSQQILAAQYVRACAGSNRHTGCTVRLLSRLPKPS